MIEAAPKYERWRVIIRQNKTGETAEFIDEYGDPYETGEPYIWTDGNYGCDCNRALFFRRAKGEAYPQDNDRCGDDAYTVLSITKPDGRVIYSETAT